jgi:DNA-binding LacI/PurR family transcriptional regulator/DNA-binding transcriptional regulator YhcF (GntR family)
MAKYDQLSLQLKNRIVQGDYTLRGLPPERQLAVESGVSYLTARRALQQLIDDGVLFRSANGRVEISRQRNSDSFSLSVGFLAPAFLSPSIDQWRSMLDQAVTKIQGNLRPVLYRHWDDPLIADALEGFDGVFLLPSTEPIPPELTQRLQNMNRPLVFLSDDMSHLGIPTVRQSSPVFVQRLLDHLEAQGHRRIDCLNVQPQDRIVAQRIEQWQVWMSAHHFPGQLINEPVESYTQPFTGAYEAIKRQIAQGNFHPDALFCVTMAAAIGATRAMHEAGIKPGIDIAVCAMDGEGLAPYQIPSTTTLDVRDVTPYLFSCLQWMEKGGGPWSGPLLMQPAEPLLVVRESTAVVRLNEVNNLAHVAT